MSLSDLGVVALSGTEFISGTGLAAKVSAFDTQESLGNALLNPLATISDAVFTTQGILNGYAGEFDVNFIQEFIQFKLPISILVETLFTGQTCNNGANGAFDTFESIPVEALEPVIYPMATLLDTQFVGTSILNGVTGAFSTETIIPTVEYWRSLSVTEVDFVGQIANTPVSSFETVTPYLMGNSIAIPEVTRSNLILPSILDTLATGQILTASVASTFDSVVSYLISGYNIVDAGGRDALILPAADITSLFTGQVFNPSIASTFETVQSVDLLGNRLNLLAPVRTDLTLPEILSIAMTGQVFAPSITNTFESVTSIDILRGIVETAEVSRPSLSLPDVITSTVFTGQVFAPSITNTFESVVTALVLNNIPELLAPARVLLTLPEFLYTNFIGQSGTRPTNGNGALSLTLSWT